MTTRQALVLGGAGMITPTVASLVAHGWHVVAPSRRYHPLPETQVVATQQECIARHPSQVGGPAALRPPQAGRALWIAARWHDSADLRARVARALVGKVGLVVSWLPAEYRVAVTKELAGLLAADAPIVEVYSGAMLTGGLPDPVLTDHPHHQVVLGYLRQGDGMRWPNREEIADAIDTGVRRALEGTTEGVLQLGEPNAWSRF